MIQALLTSPTFAAFLFASLILVTPGPGVIYIVTRTLGQGRKAGRTGGGADDSIVPCPPVSRRILGRAAQPEDRPVLRGYEPPRSA